MDASALYLTFATDHAIDVYLFEHYVPVQGSGKTYQMLLIAGIPIALGSALFFLLGVHLLRVPGVAVRLGVRAASVLSGVAVALLMFCIAHLTESWRRYGRRSTPRS